MADNELERRVEMAELKAMMETNNATTLEIKNAVIGHNGTPGLVAKQLLTEDRVKRLERFKWYDRGLALVSGVVGGWLAGGKAGG